MIFALNSTAVATSCVSSPSANDAQRLERPDRPSRTVITREELIESAAPDAYQAVQRLRPTWLRRTASSFRQLSDVLIYVDGQRFGAVGSLSRVSLNSVKEIRYHSPTDATQRWGTDHSGGVIEVITR